MNDESTARLALPLLQTGQAQKELSHNEALTLLDFATQPVVIAVGRDDPPAAPVPGACWVVGAAPIGAWSGRAHALAGWTTGGWRFVAAREGLAAWSLADTAEARFAGGAWTVGALRGVSVAIAGSVVLGARQPAIPMASGGNVVDAEARAALASMLAALRSHGLIAA